MSAGIGQQDSKTVREQKLSVSHHPHAVVTHAVKQDYGISITLSRTKPPAAQDGPILGADGDIFHIRIEGTGGPAHRGDVSVGKKAPRRMKCSIRDINASNGAEGEIDEKSEQEADVSAD